jgi:hypothetical protein
MTTYKIQNRDSGEIMESGLTLIEANEIVHSYEKEDKDDEVYIPDLYQIVPEKKSMGELNGK